MWFTRLFRERDVAVADEEPSAVAPQPGDCAAANTRPAPQPVRKPRVIDPKRKGFDPYNSGSFERRNAWERVGRR